MIGYGRCPRCGGLGLEHLRSHSHCWDCNHFPEEASGLNQWLNLEFRGADREARMYAREDFASGGEEPLGIREE